MQVNVDIWLESDDRSLGQSMSGSSSNTPSGTHLMCASLQHLSTVLALYEQQNQQPELPAAVVHLADSICSSARITAITMAAISSKQKPARARVAAGGPHSVAWQSISLLVLTYAWTFKQHGRLPAVGTSPQPSTTSSSSGDSSSGRKSSSARAPVTTVTVSSRNALDADPEWLVQGRAAWQQAQQHVPATHIQLMGLFGVSAKAAAWVAAIQPHDFSLDLASCWGSIRQSVSASAQNGDSAQLQSTAPGAQQPQPLAWSDTRLLQLLQPVLLYGAAYATPGDGTWALSCSLAAGTCGALSERCNTAGPTTVKDAAALIISSTDRTKGLAAAAAGLVLSGAVRAEMLLLNLNLLQRLQQLRKAAAGASSSGSSSHSRRVAAEAASARVVAAGADTAYSGLICLLLSLTANLQVDLLQDTTEALRQKLHRLSASGSAAAAAATSKPAKSEAAEELRVVWQQQAGAICRVFEGYVRAEDRSSRALEAELQCETFDPMIASLCLVDNHSLFRLARDGSSKQRLDFFRLLLSLLKRSGSDGSDLVTNLVADGACGMLKDASAAAVGVGVDGSNDGFGGLWLLVLSRCCLQWAAALQQVQGQGVSRCSQIMQQARQEVAEGRAVTGLHASALRIAPWLIEGRASRLSLPEQQAVVTDVVGLLAQGSGLNAGLSAAGYDVGPIVQGLEALSVCYSGVVQTECVPGDAEAGQRVGGLIKALDSVGQALSVFAVPHCCNNLQCVDTSGLSEASIVSGKSNICSGCKVARYCGKPCQTAHWKSGAHKRVCKMLCRGEGVGEGSPGVCADAPSMQDAPAAAPRQGKDEGVFEGARSMQDAPQMHAQSRDDRVCAGPGKVQQAGRADAQRWESLGWFLMGACFVVLCLMFGRAEWW
jgi:hypothetical protein